MTDSENIAAIARAIAVSYDGNRPPELPSDPTVYPSDLDAARSALAAHTAWLKAQGLVVVPVEPTEAMVNAGLYANDCSMLEVVFSHELIAAYQAMLAAAGDAP